MLSYHSNVGLALLSGAQVAFGGSLQAIILFGSGAEGRLRPTSDVNLLLVLDQFSAEAAIRLQPQLEMAYATIRLRAMFLLDSEVDAAMQAFAQKFADIGRRRLIFPNFVSSELHRPLLRIQRSAT